MRPIKYSKSEVTQFKQLIALNAQRYKIPLLMPITDMIAQVHNVAKWEQTIIASLYDIYQETLGNSNNAIGESLITMHIFFRNLENNLYNNKQNFEQDYLKLQRYVQSINFKQIDIPKAEFSGKVKTFLQDCMRVAQPERNITTAEKRKCNISIDFEGLEKVGMLDYSSVLNAIGKSKDLKFDHREKDLQFECAPMKSAKLIYGLAEKMKNLSEFHLDFKVRGGEVGDKEVEDLAVCVKQMKSVKKLTLGFGGDVSEEVVEIYKKVWNFSKTEARLWGSQVWNNATKKGMEQLASSIKGMKCLESLILGFGYNKIGADGVTALSGGLKVLTNLSNLNLDLQYNHIGADGATALSGGLKVLTNLSNLNLNLEQNNIGDGGATALSGGLKVLTNLSNLNLNLWFNRIEADGATALSGGLKVLTNLSNLNLNLEKNDIGADGATALSGGLKVLTNLSNLNLNLLGNNIRAKGKAALKELKLVHPNSIISTSLQKYSLTA